MRTPARRKTPPLLAISMGDPAGVGPEVILKAAAALASRRGAPSIVVVGDLSAMRAAAARLRDVPAPREWHPGEPPHSPDQGTRRTFDIEFIGARNSPGASHASKAAAPLMIML